MSPFPPPAMPAASPLRRAPVQIVAWLVGLAFLIFGLLELVAGVANFIDVSMGRNVLHLAIGVVGLAMAGAAARARAFLIGVASVYVVVFLCNWLHPSLAVAMQA